MSIAEFEAWFDTPAAQKAGYERGWRGIALAAWCAAQDAMATSPADDREAFEAWMRADTTLSLARELGSYREFHTTLMWHAWKACAARTQPAAATEVEAFLNDVRAELVRARAKFPGDRITTIALAEEFGELCKAVLDESAANVRKEAVQTAVMAARVVLDGDSSVREWRAGKGLDPIGQQQDEAA